MTFDELKTEVLLRASKLEVCENYQQALVSTNYQELLQAGCGLYRWLYETDITDDAILAQIPESDLNSFGWYINSISLTNPLATDYVGCKGFFIEVSAAPDEGQVIYLSNSATGTVVINGDNTLTLYSMGNSTLDLTLADNGHCRLYVYDDAVITATISGNSTLCIVTSNYTTTTVTASGNAVTTASARGFSTFLYTGNGTSKLIIKSFTKATAYYVLNDSATIEPINQYNHSLISNPLFLP